MQLEDIKKLAQMARIDMSDEELLDLAHDFEPILAYVSQVQTVEQGSGAQSAYVLTNVMRDDIATHTPMEYTEKMIAQMPDSQDGFLKVKKIL